MKELFSMINETTWDGFKLLFTNNNFKIIKLSNLLNISTENTIGIYWKFKGVYCALVKTRLLAAHLRAFL